MDQVSRMITTLGWETTDDIAVEVGGTSIYEIDGAGTKWAPCEGNSQVQQRCIHCHQESFSQSNRSFSTQP